MDLLSPIVSVAWLKKQLGNSELLIFDASIPKVSQNKNDKLANTVQIPSAQFFDIKQKFSDLSSAFPNTIPSAKQFQESARQLGVNTSSTIVVYDDKGIYSSARVWWLFKTFGFSNVAILDGGLPAWIAEGFEVEDKQVNKREYGNFKAVFNSDKVVNFETIKAISQDEKYTIIDARSSDRFLCKVPEPRAGLRSGTIPNSVNIPFTLCLNNGTFKSKAELQTYFEDVASKNQTLVFSCGSGITACVLEVAAFICGYKNTKVYDGSWTEYGSLTKE